MDNNEARWTLDQLTAEVEAALAEGYEGATNGRVRDIPDRRTIRYYTTLGLIDRPVAMRGRTALYGRRHLLQIVAIKKLQAAGRTLAEIQKALSGQTTTELARIGGQDADGAWAEGAGSGSSKADRDFWKQEPAVYAPPAPDGDDDLSEGSSVVGGRPQALCGIPLHQAVTLLLAPSRPLDADDMEAIRSAAAPLIRILTRSRLIDPREGGGNP
jgi:DNA-binding transcriptional MerR regulator